MWDVSDETLVGEGHWMDNDICTSQGLHAKEVHEWGPKEECRELRRGFEARRMGRRGRWEIRMRKHESNNSNMN